NQLVGYQLPYTTGFPSILANYPATVQNTGLEVLVGVSPIRRKNFSWTSSLNLTFPRNKLLEFPDIEMSSYSTLIVGEPVDLRRGYRLENVDLETGHYQFRDFDGDGQLRYPQDAPLFDRVVRFYGGIDNTLRFGGLTLSFFIHFDRKSDY